jgi:hypothetical protein
MFRGKFSYLPGASETNSNLSQVKAYEKEKASGLWLRFVSQRGGYLPNEYRKKVNVQCRSPLLTQPEATKRERRTRFCFKTIKYPERTGTRSAGNTNEFTPTNLSFRMPLLGRIISIDAHSQVR